MKTIEQIINNIEQLLGIKKTGLYSYQAMNLPGSPVGFGITEDRGRYDLLIRILSSVRSCKEVINLLTKDYPVTYYAHWCKEEDLIIVSKECKDFCVSCGNYFEMSGDKELVRQLIANIKERRKTDEGS